jgi:hypothetical protein
MSLTLTFDELLRYTNDERDKWRLWLVSHPAAMESPVQPSGARHATVGGTCSGCAMKKSTNRQD